MESYYQVLLSCIYGVVRAKIEHDNNFLVSYEKGLDKKIIKTTQDLCSFFSL